jgi:hypothetical protein
LAALSTSSSRAGIFSRKPKVNPSERVPELLTELKSSTEESQRSNAAEELRQFDPKSHPEIMSALIGALSKDASPAVRSEAAASLGKLRPISQQAGYALEQAQNNDGSLRVRLAARQALFQYHIVGYRSGKPENSGEKDSTQPVPTRRRSEWSNHRCRGGLSRLRRANSAKPKNHHLPMRVCCQNWLQRRQLLGRKPRPPQS